MNVYEGEGPGEGPGERSNIFDHVLQLVSKVVQSHYLAVTLIGADGEQVRPPLSLLLLLSSLFLPSHLLSPLFSQWDAASLGISGEEIPFDLFLEVIEFDDVVTVLDTQIDPRYLFSSPLPLFSPLFLSPPLSSLLFSSSSFLDSIHLYIYFRFQETNFGYFVGIPLRHKNKDIQKKKKQIKKMRRKGKERRENEEERMKKREKKRDL